VNLADPLDRAIALVRKDVEQTPAARVIGDAMARKVGQDPLVEAVAAFVYSYDQDFIDRPWRKVGPLSRQTYIEIAEGAIALVRRA